jgi:hypothetical protein
LFFRLFLVRIRTTVGFWNALASPSGAHTAEKPADIWARGQGYPRDARGLPKEGRKAYDRFQQFLALGPKRTKAATARALGMATSSIHQLATKYCWDERAKAWDSQHGLAFGDESENPNFQPPIPDRLQAVASQPHDTLPGPENPAAPLALNPVADEIRAKELEHEQMLEEFRREAELLGRRQMSIARGMTQLVGSTVAEMLASKETLPVRLIPGFISSACTLAAAAHHGWGRAIGIDRLLLQMERAVMELEARTIEDAEVIG